MKDNKVAKIILIATAVTLTAAMATYVFRKIQTGYIQPLKVTYSFIYD